MTNIERFNNYLQRAKLDSKPHQHEGVAWCLNNEINGHNVTGKLVRGGLLADEMGLGKTIQMIGVMICNFKIRTLIVLPRSLLEQWEQVIRKTLGHQPIVYHGSRKRDIELAHLESAPIVLTTYGHISVGKTDKDVGLLHHVKWSRVIFDEAHHLRNKATRAHKGAAKLDAEIRWLVTGTPIQNRRSDFYSLCDVMGLPNEYYTVTENLMELVRAFILKRTKKQVGLQLPELRTQTMDVHWTNEAEKDLAEDIHSMLQFSRINKVKVDNAIAALGLSTLPLLVRARQACVYPALMRTQIEKLIKAGLLDESENMDEALRSSSKIDTVVGTIITRRHNGKSKLVFCHYRGEIDIIKSDLTRQGMSVETFDGRISESDRNDVLTRKCDVLILQIQTGCEGLNLQHFSEIYFVSPHWNPAIEDQAVARCHRIGQTEEIDVFRFNMCGFDDEDETRTLDEYSAAVQDVKRGIMTMIEEQ
jgi:SNF2 family DNA or RNA helicase